MFFFGGGIFLPLLGVTRAGNLPVFLRVGICLLGSRTRIGMVRYAATNKSPKIFLVVRYGVTRASGSNPFGKKRYAATIR